MTKYTAIAVVTFQIEFEDDEEMDLDSQAHDAALDQLTEVSTVLDCEICEVQPTEEMRKAS